MFRFTPVVKNLLIINVGVFLGGYLLQMQGDIVRLFAMFYIESNNFKAWQFVTHMFLHASFRHILGNMLGLMVFGTMLEEIWGSKRFLQYYLITGLGAGLLYMGVQFWENSGIRQEVNAFIESPSPAGYNDLVKGYFMRVVNANPQPFIDLYAQEPDNLQYQNIAIQNIKVLYQGFISIPILGASGAVFGLLLAAGLLFPYRRVILLIPPIPVRIRILAILLGIYTLYNIVYASPTDDIAHLAHLGGLVVGYILLVVWGESQNRYQ
jgi:membrane associated rhomboid family serine protease